MRPELPELGFDEFAGRLAAALAGAAAPPAPSLALLPGAVAALFAHYRELRRWLPHLALIGPGTVATVFERHYAESLAALPWLPPGPARLVDLGSGAGFPGLVLAAARPDLEVTLVEPRQKKSAFLAAAAHRAGLGVRCLDARVERLLPPGFPTAIEILTVRALHLSDPAWRALAPALASGARLLLWSGAEPSALPSGFAVSASRPLAGGERRRLDLALRSAG